MHTEGKVQAALSHDDEIQWCPNQNENFSLK